MKGDAQREPPLGEQSYREQFMELWRDHCRLERKYENLLRYAIIVSFVLFWLLANQLTT